MVTEKEFRKFDRELFEINMLFQLMLNALKYFEMETTECTEVIYLGELIQCKINDILNENDKVIEDN